MSKVITTIRNAWRIKDLRSKILFTLFILVIYRLGAQIPVPFIDTDMLDTLNASANTGLLQYLNIFSGEAFSRATLFALSISPYITSSIVMQLLCVAIPALERMSKEEDGKKKINKITRFVTAALSLVTAIGYYFYLQQNGLVNYIGSSSGMKFFTAVVVIACYCAGAALIMWLGEKITENGIGNGISMILFANIVASFPNTLVRIFKLIFNTNKNLPDLVNSGYTVTHPNLWWIGTIIGVLGLVMCVALIAFMVFMTNSERRLPVQYAKRVVGRKMYGGQNTFEAEYDRRHAHYLCKLYCFHPGDHFHVHRTSECNQRFLGLVEWIQPVQLAVHSGFRAVAGGICLLLCGDFFQPCGSGEQPEEERRFHPRYPLR